MHPNAQRPADRARYRRLKNEGRCVECGKIPEPERQGKIYCQKCASMHSATSTRIGLKMYRIMSALKICVKCKDAQAVPGKKSCAACLESESERKRGDRLANYRSGKCGCGGERDSEMMSCPRCREKSKRNYQAQRERRDYRVAHHQGPNPSTQAQANAT